MSYPFKSRYKGVTALIATLVLTGCLEGYTSNSEDIEQMISDSFLEVKRNTRLTVEELLPKQMFESIHKDYEGSNYRDPFQILDTIEALFAEQIAEEGGNPYVLEFDPTRPEGYTPSPYESYELESFRMIGVLGLANGDYSALVDMGENRIVTIDIGDYMGTNFGEVVDITETYIELHEKYAADDQGEWYLQSTFINLDIKQ